MQYFETPEDLFQENKFPHALRLCSRKEMDHSAEQEWTNAI
jgi:hypothetical protein